MLCLGGQGFAAYGRGNDSRACCIVDEHSHRNGCSAGGGKIVCYGQGHTIGDIYSRVGRVIFFVYELRISRQGQLVVGTEVDAIIAACDRSAGNLHRDVFVVTEGESVPFFATNASAVHIQLVVALTDVCKAGKDGSLTGPPIIHLAAVHVEHCHCLCVVPVVVVQFDRAAVECAVAADLSAVQIQGSVNIGLTLRFYTDGVAGCCLDPATAPAIADVQRGVAIYRDIAGQRFSAKAEVEGVAARDGERFASRCVV